MKRTQQKEQTRKHLLDTASKIFAEKGILATNTLAIARLAKISHGSLFAHFPTRDALLQAVVDEFGLSIGQQLQKVAALGGTPREILELHLNIIEQNEPFYTRLAIEGPLLPSLIRSRIFMIQAGMAHFLEKALFQKKQPRISTHLLLNSWLGLVHYYLINKDLFAPRKSVIATCGKELVQHFCQIYQLEE